MSDHSAHWCVGYALGALEAIQACLANGLPEVAHKSATRALEELRRRVDQD